MPLPNPARIAIAKARLESNLLNDVCVPLIKDADMQNSFGEVATEESAYTPGAPTACSLDMSGGKEIEVGAETVIVDAELALPLSYGLTLKAKDRIQVTHRNTTPLSTPLVFDIVGAPRYATLCTFLNLKLVQP
jgi:hypothetical protein